MGIIPAYDFLLRNREAGIQLIHARFPAMQHDLASHRV
jgi:hypothetical protein